MRKGFTLIEVMLAGSILAIGCLGVLAMLLTVVDHNNVSQHRTDATYLAEMLLDQLEMSVSEKDGQFPSMSNPEQWSGSLQYYTKTGFFIGSAPDAVATNDWVYRVDYYRLPDDSRFQDVYRGALRVSWHTSNRLGSCGPADLDTRTTKIGTECDSVTLPFAFAKKKTN